MTDDPASLMPDAGAAPRGPLLWLLPSYADLAFIVSFITVVVVGAGRALNGDGDLASHLGVGNLILSSGSIPNAYPFTWGPEGLPFLAHAWLGEVTLAAVHNGFGLAGIVVLTATLVALSIALFVRFLLARRVRPLVVLVASLAVLALSSIHWVGRSHLFTWVGALLVLNMLEARRPVPWWWYASLFALWANLHGGYAFGILLLGAYGAGSLVEAWRGPSENGGDTALRWAPLVPLIAAVGGTMLNPRGPLRYFEIASLLGDSSIIDLINEFASPDFHQAAGRVFLVLLLTTMVALCTRPLMPWAWISVVLMGTAQGLFAIRNVPLFALCVFPLALVQLARAFSPFAEREKVQPDPLGSLRKRDLGVLPMALVGAALFAAHQGGNLGTVTVLPNHFSSTAFPVDAVTVGRQAGVDGRLFSMLGWGGYIIHAWPEQQPYLDGLLYSGELLEAQAQVEDVDPGWDKTLDRLEVDVMLVPSQGRLAYALSQNPDWAPWHCDATAVLFVRASSPLSQEATRGSETACPLVGG